MNIDQTDFTNSQLDGLISNSSSNMEMAGSASTIDLVPLQKKLISTRATLSDLANGGKPPMELSFNFKVETPIAGSHLELTKSDET